MQVKDAIKEYEYTLHRLAEAENNYASSFMDISVRIDRVDSAKKKLLFAFGDREFNKTYKDK